jgi:hypothetical protein
MLKFGRVTVPLNPDFCIPPLVVDKSMSVHVDEFAYTCKVTLTGLLQEMSERIWQGLSVNSIVMVFWLSAVVTLITLHSLLSVSVSVTRVFVC